MAKVIYERQGEETKLFATAVTYEGAVAKCTVYPNAPDSEVRSAAPLGLQGYESKTVDIPLSRVVRVER